LHHQSLGRIKASHPLGYLQLSVRRNLRKVSDAVLAGGFANNVRALRSRTMLCAPRTKR
jgi:hypothetical protein